MIDTITVKIDATDARAVVAFVEGARALLKEAGERFRATETELRAKVKPPIHSSDVFPLIVKSGECAEIASRIEVFWAEADGVPESTSDTKADSIEFAVPFDKIDPDLLAMIRENEPYRPAMDDRERHNGSKPQPTAATKAALEQRINDQIREGLRNGTIGREHSMSALAHQIAPGYDVSVWHNHVDDVPTVKLGAFNSGEPL